MKGEGTWCKVRVRWDYGMDRVDSALYLVSTRKQGEILICIIEHNLKMVLQRNCTV